MFWSLMMQQAFCALRLQSVDCRVVWGQQKLFLFKEPKIWRKEERGVLDMGLFLFWK